MILSSGLFFQKETLMKTNICPSTLILTLCGLLSFGFNAEVESLPINDNLQLSYENNEDNGFLLNKELQKEIEQATSLPNKKQAVTSQAFYTQTIDGKKLTIHSSGLVASIEVSQSEFDKWNGGKSGFNKGTDRNLMSNLFYKFFKDDFDFIFFVNNNDKIPKDISYYGQLMHIQNTIKGLGLPIFDNSSKVGSSGRLQSVIHLPYLKAMQNGPTLHEIAHNWANFFKDFEMASPNQNYAASPHWGWTSIPGQLGGFKKSTLVDLGGGNYQANNGAPRARSFGGVANGGNGLAYANWELYLMGMVPKDSLEDIIYSEDVVTTSELNGQGKFSGTKKTYTVNQFIADKGNRIPDFKSSQKEFKILSVVITPAPLTTAQWTTINSMVSWVTKKEDDGTNLYNFWEATNGVGTLIAGDLHQSLINSTSISSKLSDSPFNYRIEGSYLTVNFNSNIKIKSYGLYNSKGQEISSSLVYQNSQSFKLKVKHASKGAVLRVETQMGRMIKPYLLLLP